VATNSFPPGFDDFTRICIGKLMYFKDAYPIGEASAHVSAAFQYVVNGMSFSVDLSAITSSTAAAENAAAAAMSRFNAIG
jgi:hypothetical protein